MAKQITRDRKLTPEEAAKYRKIPEEVEADTRVERLGPLRMFAVSNNCQRLTPAPVLLRELTFSKALGQWSGRGQQGLSPGLFFTEFLKTLSPTEGFEANRKDGHARKGNESHDTSGPWATCAIA